MLSIAERDIGQTFGLRSFRLEENYQARHLSLAGTTHRCHSRRHSSTKGPSPSGTFQEADLRPNGNGCPTPVDLKP